MSDPPVTTILDNLTTAVLVLNDNLTVEYLNPAAETLLESSAQRVSGTQLERLLPTATALLSCATRALRTGQALAEREIRITLPNAREITIDCTASPLSTDGAPRALLLEIVQLDRQLQISREELQLSQHEAHRAVIRGLAHEIKNPLGGLRGAAQLLDAELPTESLKEYTQVIMSEADRLSSLLDRMLGPNNRLVRRCLNIHEVTERVRNLVDAEAPANVRLIRDYDPSIPEINGDRDLLIQAILNLARNALQALGDEGVITLRTRVRRQITIAQTRHRLVLELGVIDNGPGIDPQLGEQIFYPLVTGRSDGTGLGLMIAQSMISQHGGLIECSSEPGNTEFRVLIPIAQPEEAVIEARCA